MARKDIITGEVMEAALRALDKLIATPPSPKEKIYSRKEVFLSLRAKAKEAMTKGYSLEAVLNSLRSAGIEASESTARQYLKPGKSRKREVMLKSALSVQKRAVGRSE